MPSNPITYYLIRYDVILSRLLLGGVFIFSGFVKAVDPTGSVYKLNDYFTAFGLESLSPLALPIAVLLAVFEFLIGVTLFFGLERRFSALSAFLLMSVMTPLTLYLAIMNPVSDCGCFGDFLILSNWATFWKNVVLILLAYFLLRYNQRVGGVYNSLVQWLVVLYTILYIFSIAWIGFTYEPLFDFRPYKTGTDIRAALENDTTQMYESTLVYQKEGKKQTFTLDNYPVGDSTWQFVEAINQPVDASEEPSLTDFIILDNTGSEVTDEILHLDTYCFLLLSPDLSKADDSEINKINELFDYSIENGYQFYCVTASDDAAISEWRDNTGAEYPFYTMDKKTVATIARSNPAVLLLKEGKIIWKKSAKALPEEEQLSGRLENISLGTLIPYQYKERFIYLISIFAVPMLLLLFMEKSIAMIIRRIKNVRMKKFIDTLSENDTIVTEEELDKKEV